MVTALHLEIQLGLFRQPIASQRTISIRGLQMSAHCSIQRNYPIAHPRPNVPSVITTINTLMRVSVDKNRGGMCMLKAKKNKTHTQQSVQKKINHDRHDMDALKCGDAGGEYDCDELSAPGLYNGTVGSSSNTCCATARDIDRAPASVEFITACTCASCTMPSSSTPPFVGSVVTGLLRLTPLPSQMHRTSLPGMICTSRPVSNRRTSMNRLSKRRMYGM